MIIKNDVELFKYIPKQNQKGIFVTGDRNKGEFKQWWLNKNLQIHCFYENGKLNGEWKCYWDNGKIRDHRLYKNGKIIYEH